MTADVELPPIIVAPKPRRKRRLLRFALWFTGGLVVLWIAAFLHATWSLNRAIAALKARGEPTTFEEALARNHANAKPSKAAEYLSRAVSENERAGRPGDATAGKSAAYSLPLNVAELDSDRAYLKSGQSVLEAVERALKEEPYPFTAIGTPLSTDWFRFSLLQDFRSVARLLKVDVRSRGGQGTDQLQRLKDLIATSSLLSKEQFVSPQSIRMSVVSLAIGVARDILGPHFEAGDLLEFDSLLNEVDAQMSLFQSLINERAVNASLFQTPEALRGQLRSDLELRTIPPPTTMDKVFQRVDQIWTEFLCTPVGLPLRLRTAANSLSVPNNVLRLVDKPLPWSLDDSREFERWKDSLDPGNVFLCRPNSAELQSAVVAFRRIHRQIALLRLALRILHHQKVQGELPESLADVCRDAPDLPKKWFANESVLYSKEDRGFRLNAPPSVVPDVPIVNQGHRVNLGLLLDVRWLPPNALP